MAQLLIELLSEEIPARMQLQAARDFERLMGGKLTAAGLTFDAALSYVGPRRLVLRVEGLPTQTAAVSEEVKGPREGAPPQALEGFLRKVGLTQDQLVVEGGVYLARIEKPGVKTAEVLAPMLREVILGFPWPKSMRSGTSTFRWVRPLKRILFLFDGAVIPFELEGLTAGNQSEGHRFLSSGEPFTVADFTSYEKALADHFVILDHKVRQDIIAEAARNICADAGCELIEDHGLLEEVAGLNEYPVPLLGDMDPAFLALPPEVIKTSMRTHQKYFAVRDNKGKMTAKFLITANTKAVDGGTEIKRGNAKVLSARLSDGVFFWNEDNRSGNFDAWLEKLKGVTFHAKLGTMAQRVERIEALAGHIAGLIGADVELTKKAARLAKADLASHMVMEFPELQGVMGGYYADAAKLEPEVANAIREHYKPQGPNDSLPEAKVSAAVALADKIDTLVGFFAIDEKPTGSKDPQALRRSTLGILRIIRESEFRISLDDLVGVVHQTYINKYKEIGALRYRSVTGSFRKIYEDGILYKEPAQKDAFYYVDKAAFHRSLVENLTNIDEQFKEDQNARFFAIEEVGPSILDFFIDRLKVQLREEGRPLDVIEAVLAVADDDVVRLIDKIKALEALKGTPAGDDLFALHKRAANILAAAKVDTLPEPRDLPGAPAVETTLIAQLKRVTADVNSQLHIENFQSALLTLAAMRQNVDAFLDGVLVNDTDDGVRTNRLAILAGICSLSKGIADLGKIA